jgi:hypothetical protein
MLTPIKGRPCGLFLLTATFIYRPAVHWRIMLILLKRKVGHLIQPVIIALSKIMIA